MRLPPLACVILLMGSTLLAQPATAPATQQGVIPPDQTSPRGALKMLTLAMNKGDANAITAVFAPANELEKSMLQAVIEKQQAEAKLREAATAAFGAVEARKLVGDVAGDEVRALMSIDAAKEEINGDSATVILDDQPTKLTRQDGKWTLPIATIAPPMNEQSVHEGAKALRDHSQCLNELSAELARGRYRSAEEAGRALQRKILQQVMSHEATSQPASAPAPQ